MSELKLSRLTLERVRFSLLREYDLLAQRLLDVFPEERETRLAFDNLCCRLENLERYTVALHDRFAMRQRQQRESEN